MEWKDCDGLCVTVHGPAWKWGMCRSLSSWCAETLMLRDGVLMICGMVEREQMMSMVSERDANPGI